MDSLTAPVQTQAISQVQSCRQSQHLEGSLRQEPEERGIQLTAGRVDSEESLGQTLSDRDPSNQGSDSLARHKITQSTILGQVDHTPSVPSAPGNH